MDALRTPVLIITFALLAVYWVGLAIGIIAGIDVLRARKDTVSRADLLNVAKDVRLEACQISSWEAFAGRLGYRAFVPAMLMAVLAGAFAPALGLIALAIVFPLNFGYAWTIQHLGKPVVLTGDGFTVFDGKKARTVPWIHVSELVLGRGPGIILPARSVSAAGMGTHEANAVLYRINRALVDMPRVRGYWDGAIVNCYGMETADLLDAMRIRKSRKS